METPNRAVADHTPTVHPFARPFGDRAPLVRHVFSRAHATREDHPIPPVLKWIAQKGGTVTLRELLRGKAGGVKNQTEAGRLLRELEDRGYGTLAKGERKDSLVFRLTDS